MLKWRVLRGRESFEREREREWEEKSREFLGSSITFLLSTLWQRKEKKNVRRKESKKKKEKGTISVTSIQSCLGFQVGYYNSNIKQVIGQRSVAESGEREKESEERGRNKRKLLSFPFSLSSPSLLSYLRGRGRVSWSNFHLNPNDGSQEDVKSETVIASQTCQGNIGFLHPSILHQSLPFLLQTLSSSSTLTGIFLFSLRFSPYLFLCLFSENNCQRDIKRWPDHQEQRSSLQLSWLLLHLQKCASIFNNIKDQIKEKSSSHFSCFSTEGDRITGRRCFNFFQFWSSFSSSLWSLLDPDCIWSSRLVFVDPRKGWMERLWS